LAEFYHIHGEIGGYQVSHEFSNGGDNCADFTPKRRGAVVEQN